MTGYKQPKHILEGLMLLSILGKSVCGNIRIYFIVVIRCLDNQGQKIVFIFC